MGAGPSRRLCSLPVLSLVAGRHRRSSGNSGPYPDRARRTYSPVLFLAWRPVELSAARTAARLKGRNASRCASQTTGMRRGFRRSIPPQPWRRVVRPRVLMRISPPRSRNLPREQRLLPSSTFDLGDGSPRPGVAALAKAVARGAAHSMRSDHLLSEYAPRRRCGWTTTRSSSINRDQSGSRRARLRSKASCRS